MKQISTALFLCFACLVYGQESILTAIPEVGNLNEDQQKVVAMAINIPKIDDISFAQWDFSSISSETGEVSVDGTIFGESEMIAFQVEGFDFGSDGEYSILASNSDGAMTVHSTPFGIGATIQQNQKSYSLFPIGNGQSVLVQHNPELYTGGDCGAQTKVTSSEINYCTEDCGRAVLDVLVLVSPAARTWLNDNYGWYSGWFLYVECHNINGALFRSAVPGKRVRAVIRDYTPTFTLTNSVFSDLTNMSTNNGIMQMAGQFGADITMMLTADIYPGIYGAILGSQFDPLGQGKVGIAEVPAIGPIRYTLAHEIAHHFGCDHSLPSPTTCPHGTQMSDGSNTIMAFAANGTRIQNFSNPAVTVAGTVTGVASIRDNAAQIRGAFCYVADNEEPNIFTVNFSTGKVCIDLPFYASASTTLGWQRMIYGIEQFCSGPISYTWTMSTTPSFSNSTVLGHSSTIFLPSPPSCNFYLRLTVTSPVGCSSSVTKHIECSPPPCHPPLKGNSIVQNRSNHIAILSPNPAKDEIFFNIGIENILRIKIIDQSGRIVSSNRFAEAANGMIRYDLSDVPIGMYFIAVEQPDKVETYKFVHE